MEAFEISGDHHTTKGYVAIERLTKFQSITRVIQYMVIIASMGRNAYEACQNIGRAKIQELCYDCRELLFVIIKYLYDVSS